jgi:transcriptional regulator with XRE-family HTH domain
MPRVKAFCLRPIPMLGTELRRRRERRGLTQAQVAHSLGDASRQGEISRWERGIRQPAYANLVKLAGIYEMEISDLGEWLEVDPETENLQEVGRLPDGTPVFALSTESGEEPEDQAELGPWADSLTGYVNAMLDLFELAGLEHDLRRTARIIGWAYGEAVTHRWPVSELEKLDIWRTQILNRAGYSANMTPPSDRAWTGQTRWDVSDLRLLMEELERTVSAADIQRFIDESDRAGKASLFDRSYLDELLVRKRSDEKLGGETERRRLTEARRRFKEVRDRAALYKGEGPWTGVWHVFGPSNDVTPREADDATLTRKASAKLEALKVDRLPLPTWATGATPPSDEMDDDATRGREAANELETLEVERRRQTKPGTAGPNDRE